MRNLKQFGLAVALLAIGGTGKAGWTCASAWVANAEISHQSEAVQAEEQAEVVQDVSEIKQLLIKITERDLAEAAAREALVKLCLANDVSDCSRCQDVGVYDTPACKKKNR